MKHMNTQTRYLTDKALAERFSVSRQTVWRWVRERHLPAPCRLSANTTRWDAETIAQWEAKQAAEGEK